MDREEPNAWAYCPHCKEEIRAYVPHLKWPRHIQVMLAKRLFDNWAETLPMYVDGNDIDYIRDYYFTWLDKK